MRISGLLSLLAVALGMIESGSIRRVSTTFIWPVASAAPLVLLILAALHSARAIRPSEWFGYSATECFTFASVFGILLFAVHFIEPTHFAQWALLVVGVLLAFGGRALYSRGKQRQRAIVEGDAPS